MILYKGAYFVRAWEGGASTLQICGRRSDALKHRAKNRRLSEKWDLDLGFVGKTSRQRREKDFKAVSGGQKFLPPNPLPFCPLIRHGFEIPIWGLKKLEKS